MATTSEHLSRPPYERDLSIDEAFARAASVRPSAIAVAGHYGTLTYDEVERDSNRIANALVARGVKPGDAIGVAFERSMHLPPVLLGILKAGAAYVPLDPSYPHERVAWMIEDAAVSLVVVDGLHELTAIGANCASVAELLACADDVRPGVRSGPESVAYVMYTSGSTGRPKGVVVEHRGVVRLVCGTDYVTIGPDDAFLHFAPLAFDASTFEIWGPLLNGARLSIPKPGPAAIDDLAETIDRFGVTTMFLTTALFGRLVDSACARPRSLRTLLTGGEVASPSHMARFIQSFPDCRLVAVYGPTENTTFSTWCDVTPSATLASSIPIGRPIANSSAYVLGDALQPLPAGAEGELCVGGDGVARGYLNRPDLTSERFVADPFAGDPGARLYRTGDRARRRSDGLLEFLGRNDDQVKVRGFRIELGEIEVALRGHEAVGDAAVVVTERGAEKELVAHVVLRPAMQAGERDLRAWLSRTLPSFMIPHRIAVRAELPLTASGKVDRVALANGSIPTAPKLRASNPNAKFSETESAIAEIWRDVLRHDDLPGPDENFFDAGGDSLRLLAVHARLREELGAALSVTDLFEHSTIRKLAAFVGPPAVRA